MYTLRYLNNNEALDNKEDLMVKIKKLQQSGEFNNQFVVIEKEGYGFMEMVLGMGEESMLFYTPESKEEDCKISCNETVARAKSEELMITSLEGEQLVFAKSNTIPLKDVYKTVGVYLNGDDFMGVIDWYSY